MNPVLFCEPQEAEEKSLSPYAFRGECMYVVLRFLLGEVWTMTRIIER